MAARYVVGIDLGTTNTVVACALVEHAQAQDPGAGIGVFLVSQFLAAGEVASLPALPSALYLTHPDELPLAALQLPWDAAPPSAAPVVVGEAAKRMGAKTPGRLITSAKSWLCHNGVDREAPLLPWGAAAHSTVTPLSPLDASARVLEHVRRAWDHAHPQDLLAQQEVVLTVPASFDEVARELTVKAAAQCGLPKLTLLEEPQAALYDFVAAQGSQLARALTGKRLVLVVDVGGGTTDLTLVEVTPRPNGEVALKRIAVGDHILLGGDNMDLALAHWCERKAVTQNAKWDAAQWSQLVHHCRMAKQALLSEKGGPAKYGVSVASRGSKLLGGAIKVELSKEDALGILLDGFFPTGQAQPPRPRSRAAGLSELGLPYASEPSVPQHLSAFLWRHAEQARAALGLPSTDTALPRPDAVLLNGGVFRAAMIKDRLAAVFKEWYPSQNGVPFLPHTSLDAAVARGAVYHGLTKRGLGHRIGGGSARAFYVGLEGDQALCLVPRGFDGAQEISVPRMFALTVGKPSRFSLYASTVFSHEVGAVVALTPADAFEELPPIQTVLEGAKGEVHVQLHALMTELGTLELSCVSAHQRWRMQFQLRVTPHSTAAPAPGKVEGALPPVQRGMDEARDWIDRIYGKRPLPVEARDVKALSRNLARALGEREEWNTATLRELFTPLWSGADRRRRSPDHERVWLMHVGYTLRPGFGAPLDPFRVRDVFGVFDSGLTHVSHPANWIEWWVMWRRVAGGLTAAQQARVLEVLSPYIRPHLGPGKPAKPKGPKAEGRDEMVRLLASLERITAAQKAQVGGWLLAELGAPQAERKSWWPLGRLGARVPFHGSLHDVVSVDTAEQWLAALLQRDWKTTEGAAFAATMLSRHAHDRARDVSAGLRTQVATRLRALSGHERWVHLVEHGDSALDQEDSTRLLGESLPAGLRLVEDAPETT